MTLLLIDAFVEYDIADLPEALMEGKSLGTYKGTDDIRQALLNYGFDLASGEFKKARRRASSTTNKQFAALMERIKRGLHHTAKRWIDGEITKGRWQRWTKQLLREAYFDAFDMGLKSSGAESLRAGRAKMDTDWIESAWRQEMIYLSRFLKQIEDSVIPAKWGTDKDPESPYFGRHRMLEPARLSDKSSSIIQRRLEAYADSIKHVYYAGRVMGTPAGMVIHWVSPLDRNTCKGCRFLSDYSPYTKENIPTTPRAGDTRCLNNCRCRLVMAEVSKDAWRDVRRKHRSQRWYRDKLRRLKEGRLL